MAAVTLETKCWEGDWRRLLQTDRLRELAERNVHPFADRVLLINNVRDRDRVCRHAAEAVERGWITRYLVVEDHARAALEQLGVEPASLGAGYVYSVAELVGICACRTEYLLHYSGDAIPERCVEWLAAAIALMESDPRIKVANLAWNGLYEQARTESQRDAGDFWIGQGFSDQCYLVRVDEFRRPIYAHTHPASERYPAYAGELFEKRVDAWMRSTGALRATYKHGAYVHRNFPKPLAHRIAAQWQRMRRAVARIAGWPRNRDVGRR